MAGNVAADRIYKVRYAVLPQEDAGEKAPHVIENARLVVGQGVISEISPACCHHDFKSKVVDLGDQVLAPPLVNCHCHLQLSFLAPYVKMGEGFVPWLKSLVPPLLEKGPKAYSEPRSDAALSLYDAMEQAANSGTATIGDVGGTLSGAIELAHDKADELDITLHHFCEWFGHGLAENLPWPAASHEFCEKEGDKVSTGPCGHALYSTSAQTLRKIKDWCRAKFCTFSIHLAESPEETELLVKGKGDLRDYYAGLVLPENWLPPGLPPVKLAKELDLLDSATLAVHCVQLDREDINILADSGCSVCLCPRSNDNLKVGQAPVKKLLQAGINLCLGTDGLTSNTDLDLRNESYFLREKEDLSPWVLLRMLSVNGAKALVGSGRAATLFPGQKAVFTLMKSEFFDLPV